MATITLYHNPRCSKSRQALKLLEDHGATVRVVHYLDTPPSPAELASLVDKLGLEPEQLVRRNEELFRESFQGRALSDQEWLEALSKNPKLIERPIAVAGRRAVLGRPPENVLELL